MLLVRLYGTHRGGSVESNPRIPRIHLDHCDARNSASEIVKPWSNWLAQAFRSPTCDEGRRVTTITSMRVPKSREALHLASVNAV